MIYGSQKGDDLEERFGEERRRKRRRKKKVVRDESEDEIQVVAEIPEPGRFNGQPEHLRGNRVLPPEDTTH